MKKNFIRLVAAVLVLSLSMCMSVFAADTNTENNLARIIAQNGASAAFASSNDNEEKILVTYKNSDTIIAGGYYLVMVIDGATGGSNYIPTKESILYVDQRTGSTDGSVSFEVFPSKLTDSAIIIYGESVGTLVVAFIDVIETVPMFRMYDPNAGEHFYTGSVEERDGLVDAGWNYEGVAFNFPVIGSPVYRLYNPVTGDHLYTMDEDEMDSLLDQGWDYENVAFNTASSSQVPQYRLWNPNVNYDNGERGAWHFTGSVDERDWLISLGWQDQGIGWYSTLN